MSKRTLSRSARVINSRAVSALLALTLLPGTAATASAQVFLAARPHPEFMIGPLIVGAAVPQDLGTVRVNVSWSLSVPTGKKPAPSEDLFLLWPREVAAPTVAGAADPDVARYVEARRSGAVIAGDTLRAIEPGASMHADVLRLCGPPQEERQRQAGRQRTLVYRGTVVTTHRRFGLGWLATVSHREIEHHEVVIEIENDRVRDVEARVGRARTD